MFRLCFRILMLCFLFVNYKAQTEDIVNTVKNSTNFKKNIVLLEAVLKKESKLLEEDKLKLQGALINNYLADGQYQKSVAFCQSEILNSQKNNQPLSEANLYISLARSYYYLNQNEKVILYNNKALAIAEEKNYLDVLKRCNHNLGVVAFEYENNIHKAKNYFLKAINYGNKTLSTKESNNAKQYRLLATCYDVLEDFKRADSVFVITESIYKSFNDSLGLSDALTFHARLYYSQKLYDKALLLCEQSLQIATKSNNTEYIQTALSMQEQIYSEIKDFKKAYELKSQIFELQQITNSKNQEKEIAEAEAKFNVAELQNKQNILALQNKQSIRNNIFFFIIVLIIVIAIILFVYQKRLSQQEQKIKVESLTKVYEAEEKERIRIAKDLHDNMGSYTTSILSQIDIIEYVSDTEKIKKIKDLRSDAENIMSTLRETIWILKNKNVSINQFYDLIKNYSNKHLVKNLNVNVSYYDEIENGNIELNSTISLHLYRIIQEVIQNIIKHSRATKVQFKITNKQKLTIEIVENGKGFNPDDLIRQSGLDHMKQRSGEINYMFNLNSDIGKGTTIIISEK